MHVLFVHQNYPAPFRFIAPCECSTRTEGGDMRRFMRSAFTLVELLVVVGIITVLIAILLPVLNKAREHAVRIQCASNLRSQGHALMMYTQQYRFYPGCFVGFAGSRAYALWPVRLRPFLNGEQRAFHCPARPAEFEWHDTRTLASAGGERADSILAAYGYAEGELLMKYTGVPFSYGYNAWGDGSTMNSFPARQRGLGGSVSVPGFADPRFREMPASRVRVPSDMVAIVDSAGSRTLDFAVIPHRNGPSGPGTVHGGGANALFCDGHVQWYRRDDLLVGPESGKKSPPPGDELRRRMWNNDNNP